MDGDRFDAFVRGIATPRTRRGFLGGATGALLALVGLRESSLAAKLRGPGETCRSDENCIAGSRCQKDTRGRLYCTCNSGMKPCGETCVPNGACCRDADCTSLNTPCASGVCANGSCQAKPKPDGVTCSGGKCCDGDCTICCHGVGQCATCETAEDCPGQDTDCTKITCISGVCGTSNVPNGTATTNQTAGDCKKVVCNGSGGTTQVTDATDLPAPDSNQCTESACVDGAPTQRPLASGTVCNQNGGRVCNSAGQCVACVSADDCPGQNTDCLTIICTNGACGVSRTDEGTPVSAQTPGDCTRVECDGLGGTIEVIDNTDTPANTDPCIQNICVSGVPTPTYVESGTTCGADLICDGVGACVGCITADDCPGDDTECQSRTCVSGVCGQSFADPGTAVSEQTSGDCQQVVCDGSGNTTSVADDDDLPDDDNDCTKNVCTEGVPSHPPIDAGVGCTQNGGSVCDGSGSCVECVDSTDCPGTDTDCQAVACFGGACGYDYASYGTYVSSQTPEDCRQDVCDGSGGTTTVDDDADVANDGNQCTENICVAGTPSHPPVDDGAECDQDEGSVCLNGFCVKANGASCRSEFDCFSGFCVDGVCCDSGCDGLCAGCTAALKGSGDDGVCGPIQAGIDPDDECPGSRTCDGAGACDGCDSPADCPGGDTECSVVTCDDGICGVANADSGTETTSQTTGDCLRIVCDGSGGTTTVADDNDLPDDGSQCTENVCTDGTGSHLALPLGTECTQSGGVICDGNGACVPQKLLGSSCSEAVECSSGFCIDGVCCDSVCSAGCRACTTALKGAGIDGVCGGIAPGTDPRDECPGTSVCSDSGECSGCTDASQCPGASNDCQRPTCIDEVCGTEYTPNGTAVTDQIAGDCKQQVCDGNGAIITVNDNADEPENDDGSCIITVCSNGEPVGVSAPSGTSCSENGGSVCDGTGVCVGCVETTDCSAASECEAATCVEGQCALTYAEAGTLCQNGNKVCDGAGNCNFQALNGTPCSVNIQCSGGACVDGYCCNSVCTAECRACNVPDRLGQCSIAVGTICDDGIRTCDSGGDCV